MGIIQRLFEWADPFGLVDTADEDPYRCLACGRGHQRRHTECPGCGARFVVETGHGDGQSAGPDRA